MPTNFLRRIEHASFPLAIHEESDIHCAAVLAAAQLIEANLPEPGSLPKKSGVVLQITPMGRAELKRMDKRGESAANFSAGVTASEAASRQVRNDWPSV